MWLLDFSSLVLIIAGGFQLGLLGLFDWDAAAAIFGTHESLLRASAFIEMIEQRQNFKVACPEEIAYRMGFIDAAQLARLAEPLAKSGYGQYLYRVIEKKVLLPA